jgi:hypothetical protein
MRHRFRSPARSPGLTLFREGEDWIYVAAVGIDSEHPTQAQVFGRFDPAGDAANAARLTRASAVSRVGGAGGVETSQ